MFKRLRERIAEEATKFPVGQLSNNSGKLLSEPENKPSENNPSEDLITLSDSSSVVVPHTSPQQFSIGEDEDGSLSEQSTPQKRHNASGDTYAHSVKEHSHSSVFSDFSFGPEYRPSKKLSYVPQSDIESEREEPPTLNLDEISKDQLLSAIQSLKARCYKYKNKYTEVVKNYKELREEKTKIENALIENQDKGLRRIGELREQCQLEQKAKAHLEENLRLLLDEKDSRICVLETQINLLKEVGKSSSTKTLPEDCENDAFADSKSEDSTTSLSGDVSVLQEKVERLQHQHNQDKKTITAQRDQISILRKQSENLSQELEEKVKRLNGLEDEQLKLKSDHETVLKAMQDRLRELEQQQEESVMSMAETKKNIYDELELKDKRLLKAEEESKFYQVAAEKAKEQASILTKKHEERVNELLHQLAVTEKTLEEEKQSLLQELAQGKAAAINLMQQECSKKVLAIEEEWKSKYEAIQSACQKAGEAQVKGMLDSQGSLQDKLNKAEQHIQELDSLVATLEQENASLKNSVEKLEAEVALANEKYEKLEVSYSDYEMLKQKEALFEEQEISNLKLKNDIEKLTVNGKELNLICESLKQLLQEQNNVVTNLEKEKSALTDQIKKLELIQAEFEGSFSETKIALSVSEDNLKNKSSEVEKMCLENSRKSDEIQFLNHMLEGIKVNEKLLLEKLNTALTEGKEFEMENAELLLENRLLNDKVESLECSLSCKEKELQCLNDNFFKSHNEIVLLKDALQMKELELETNYKQFTSLLTSVEKKQTSMRQTIIDLEALSKFLCIDSRYVSEKFQLVESYLTEIHCRDKSLEIQDNCTCNVKRLKEFGESNEEKSSLNYVILDEEVGYHLGKHIVSDEISILKKENHELQTELDNCKSMLELQNIEFAKSITILQQSLTELQEERNNLSLVLQNIENDPSIQVCESNRAVPAESSLLKMASDGDCQKNWDLKILELNSKVKFEMDALSLQTEIVNKELKNLRKQFKSNQDSFAEKLIELKIKLLHRTELLVNLKENLDSSVENANLLREFLESAKQDLNEKTQILNTLEDNNKDLENKYKEQKEKSLQRECDLKYAHNLQLAELKNHTKLMLDKLTEEVNKANNHLKAKEEEFNLKLKSLEESYKKQVDETLMCHTKIQKLSDHFENQILGHSFKLDSYSTRIFSLTSRVNHLTEKLKEKDYIILNKENAVLELETQLKGYTELQRDYNSLQNECSLTSDSLKCTKKELTTAKERFLFSEEKISKMKEEYKKSLQAVSACSNETMQEVNRLQLLLAAAAEELENTQIKYADACSNVSHLERELQELRENLLSANDQKSSKQTFDIASHIESLNKCLIQNVENINQHLQSKENKLKDVESKFFIFFNMYSSKTQDITNLRAELATSVKDTSVIKEQLKEVENKLKISESLSTEYKSKYEDTLLKIREICNSFTFQSKSILADYDNYLNKATKLLSDCDIKLSNLETKFSLFSASKMKEIPRLESQVEFFCTEISGLKLLLEQQNNKFEVCKDSAVEWKSKYDGAVLQIKNLSLKHEASLEELKLLFSEKETALNDAQNKIISIEKNLEKYEVESKEMCSMQAQLAESKDSAADWKSKYDSSVLQVKNLSLQHEASVEELKLLLAEKETALDDAKSKIGDIEKNLEKYEVESKEMSSIQAQLSKSLEDLKNYQTLLDEQIEKFTAIEHEKLDLKQKYEIVVEDLKKVTDAGLEDKENIQHLLSEIDSKTAQINSMVSPDKLKEIEKCHQEELNELKDKNKKLMAEIQTMSQILSEKENSIKIKENERNNIEAHHEERLRCMKDKLQNAEKNHKTQMEQLKTKLSQLEKENGILLSEKENLLVVQNHFKELKSMENKLQTELKLKDEELKKFQEKLETSSKEEVEKICTLQESMKDKENMILKLKANVESLSKDHSTTVEELNKKIKRLEVEREQLMLQAQERVSATEAKCREDVKSLQEKCDRLVSENGEIEKLKKQVLTLNSQLDESLLMAESNQAVASQEISVLKEKLACAETKLTEIEKSKSLHETELSSKLEKLQQENKELLCNSDHVEKLKTEKEELNEKLKKAVQQVNKISVLENECGRLKTENEELSKEVKHIKIIENESIFIREKLRIFEENESAMKKSMQDLSVENEKLKAEIVELKASFEKEKESLLSVNGGLKKKIEQLENSDLPVKDYVESLKKEYDAAIKAKDDDMLSKLKQLVRDFSLQMDVKDKDSELMITELMEKNQYLEEKLQKDHALEITALRQDLFEKDCALEEMRDSYEETIQERDALIKKYELAIKSLSAKEDTISHELINNAAEPSDWDDTWVVPDEVVENSSPIHEQKACQEHVQQIESLQEELSKSNSEIKELKVLLRLSPPETMVENNNRRDSLQSIPEPTEFEYLKNIIYEYMMGKEPVTLVKVIAAVLRFNDTQTQQVIRREEARHSTK